MIAWRPVAFLAVATGALALALAAAPGATSTWVHVYLVVVAAGLLAGSLRAVGELRATTGPSLFDAARYRARRRPERPEDLELLERLVTIGTANAYDLHYRLRPAVREIAAGLLLRRGIELDAQPALARDALGDAAWDLVRPDREAPGDRQAPGIAPQELNAVLAALEGCR